MSEDDTMEREEEHDNGSLSIGFPLTSDLSTHIREDIANFSASYNACIHW